MSIAGGEFCLSSVHVYRSSADAVFIARSDRYPGLVARNEWSALAALDALLDLIEQQRPHHLSADRPAA